MQFMKFVAFLSAKLRINLSSLDIEKQLLIKTLRKDTKKPFRQFAKKVKLSFIIS